AVTNVDRDTMVRGKPVHQANIKLDPKDLRDDDVQFRSHVNPGRESVLGGRGDREAPRPQRDDVRVREKMEPPQRASVEERRRAIERDISRPNRDAGDRSRGNDRNDRQVTDNNRNGRNDRQAMDNNRNDRNDRPAMDNNRVPRPPRSNDGWQNGRGSIDADRGRGNDRNDRQVADANRVPRPGNTDSRDHGRRRDGNDRADPHDRQVADDNRVPRPGNTDSRDNGRRRDGNDRANPRIVPGPADRMADSQPGSDASV